MESLLTVGPHTCMVTIKGQAHASHTSITLPLRAAHTGARERTLRYSVSQAERLTADRVAIEPVQRSNCCWGGVYVLLFSPSCEVLHSKAFLLLLICSTFIPLDKKGGFQTNVRLTLVYFYLLSNIFCSSSLMILPRAAACSNVRTLAKRSSLISSR